MTTPEAGELRATLAELDERQRKIVGGVVAILIEQPERARERELVVEQYTQVVLLACGFEDVASVHDGVEQVQAYAREQIDPLLNATFALFVRTAADLADRAEPPSKEEAVAHALGYLAGEA